MKKYTIEKGYFREKTTIQIVILIILFLLYISVFNATKLFGSRSQINVTNSVFPTQSAPVAATVQTPIINEFVGDIIFMGDTMLARGVGNYIENGVDPFENVSDVISRYSLRVANIETTIADPVVSSQAAKPYTFNAPLESLDILQKNKIDVSVLANNHTGDFGPNATANMIDQFKKANLVQSGLGKTTKEAFAPRIINMPLRDQSNKDTSKTAKVAFISVNEIELAHTKVTDSRAGGAYFDTDKIKESVAVAKKNGAEIIVIVAHWGIEYQLKQSKNQENWAKFFIDSGADVVIGGHPHVIQPITEYKGKPIVYSLGNFIFDGMSGNALDGQMVGLEFRITETKSTNGRSRKISLQKPKIHKYSIDYRGFPILKK